MAQVSATNALEAYLDGAWTALTTRRVGDLTATWGMTGRKPIDLLADPGRMSFTLRNDDGAYTPGHASVVSADWKKGCQVRQVTTYDGFTRTWLGYIGDFSYESDYVHNRHRVTVFVVDWMDKASKFPMDYPDVVLEKRADQLAQIVLDLMPTPPQETDLEPGTNVFKVGFDTVTDFTYARTELAKIAISEPAHMYVRHGGDVGEKLVLENAETRENATVKQIPIVSTESGFLLLETGDYLLLETGDKLILDEAEEFTSVNDAMRTEASYGDNVINDVRFRYTPREYYLTTSGDSATKRTAFYAPELYSGGLQLTIPATTTKKFSFKWGANSFFYVANGALFGTFAENGANNSVLGTRKLGAPLPAAFTAFQMFDGPLTASDVDISADLVLVSLDIKMDRVDFELTNNNAGLGYLRLSLVSPAGGSQIVNYPDEQVTIQDTASIASEDYQPLSFDMVYQTDEVDGTAFANQILGAESFPRTTLDRLHFCANSSPHNMMAFMTLDIGDMFPAVDTNKGIDGYFFVQNMAYTISPGGIINWSVGLVDNYSPPGGLQVALVGTVVTDTFTGAAPGGQVSTAELTIPSGSNRLAVVEVATRGGDTVSTVTLGGRSLTLLGAYEMADTVDDPRIEIWYLVNPPVGTYTVTMTLTAAGQGEMAAMSFVNVDQDTPFGTFVSASGTSTTPSVTAAGAALDLMLDVVSTRAAPTVGAGQTSRWAESCDGAWRGAGSTELGAASVVMSWSMSSAKWAIGAVAIKAKP